MKIRLFTFTIGILIGSILLFACSSGGGGGDAAPALTAPAAPTGLAATVVSTSAINLTWTDASSNEDNFILERGTDGTTFALLATTAANVTSYSDTGLSSATLYYYRIKATNSAGESAYSTTANATTQSPALDPLVLAPRYSIAPNWNDYVNSSNTATTCSGTEIGGYTACIHGGENLVVPVVGKTSCTGITATDSLGAFAWSCDGSTNPVRMVTKALNSGKYLSDLIDFTTTAWKQNAVTVYDGGTAYNSTSAAIWWTNPVILNNSGGNLSTAGTIYTVNSNPSLSYVINANKVGLVIKPGSMVTATTSDVISVITKTFVWIEGAVDGGAFASRGVLLDTVNFSVLRNIAVKNAAVGIMLNSSNNNRMMGLRSANNNGNGILLNASGDNILADITISNNGSGAFINGFGNTLVNMTSSNNAGSGIFVNGPNNKLVSITLSHNSSTGLETNNSPNTFIADVVSENSGSGGIAGGLYIQSSSDNTIANFVSAENVVTPTILLNTTSNNYFTGLLKVASSVASPCIFAGVNTNPGLTGATCAIQGPISNASVSTGISLGASFVAKVTTNDSANASDINGLRDVGVLLDWNSFENTYRSWGKDGGAFPNVDQQGRCVTSGNCRIWDWSLKSADTMIKGVLTLPAGNDFISHKWIAGNQPACIAISGAAWNSSSSTCFSEVLRNAVEIIGDGIGNDNGLCESGETCLYTPNIGSYQGHGSLISAGTFTNGFISGVTLLKFTTNGY